MEPWTELFARRAQQLQVKPQDQSWPRLRQKLNRRRPVMVWINRWSIAATIMLFVVSAVAIRLFINSSDDGLKMVGELEALPGGDNYFVNSRPPALHSPEDRSGTLIPAQDPLLQEKYAYIMAGIEPKILTEAPLAVSIGDYILDPEVSESVIGKGFKITEVTELNLSVNFDDKTSVFLRIPGQSNLYVRQTSQLGLYILEVLPAQQVVLKWYNDELGRFESWTYRLSGAS